MTEEAGRAAPGCSVVIVTYRSGPVLGDCLRALLGDPAARQIIIVDNNDRGDGGEDGRAALAGMAADPRIETLAGHGNIGFARGCNLGAARAREPFLLLLNPDCVIQPSLVTRALAVLTAAAGMSMAGVRLQNPDGSEQRGGRRNLLTPATGLVELLRLDRLVPGHPRLRPVNLNRTPPPRQPAAMECVSGAFMLMPRQVYAELGGMDAGYFLHVEDIDFCMRLARSGRKILYIPDLAVTHRQGSSRVFPGFVEWHKARGMVRYFRKHFRDRQPTPLLALVLAAILIRFALVMVPKTITWSLARLRRNSERG